MPTAAPAVAELRRLRPPCPRYASPPYSSSWRPRTPCSWREVERIDRSQLARRHPPLLSCRQSPLVGRPSSCSASVACPLAPARARLPGPARALLTKHLVGARRLVRRKEEGEIGGSSGGCKTGFRDRRQRTGRLAAGHGAHGGASACRVHSRLQPKYRANANRLKSRWSRAS